MLKLEMYVRIMLQKSRKNYVSNLCQADVKKLRNKTKQLGTKKHVIITQWLV